MRFLIFSLLFLVVATEPHSEVFAEPVPLNVPARLVIPDEYKPTPKLELIVSESVAPAEVGANDFNGVHDVELWMAPFYCAPCNRLKAELGNGNSRVRVKRFVAPSDWRPSDGGFPFVRVIDSQGNGHVLHGVRDLAQLERNIDRIEGEISQPVSAMEVGASFAGRAVIEAVLSQIEAIAGPDASMTFKWQRKGAKDALVMGQKFTREDIVGTSGRIEIVITSANKLPVQSIKFNYRFDENGKPFIDLDETPITIPDDGTVGSAEPVGSPFMIAWTVISTIQTIYALFNPTVDVWLGPEVTATATLKDHALIIDCGKKPPAVRLHWSFFFNLLRFEHSRPLTGGIISADQAVAQFHKSARFRDVTIPIR